MRVLDFAGFGNTFGQWALLATAVACALCGLGTLALAVTGRVGMRRGLWTATGVLICAAVTAGWFARAGLAEFHTLEVYDDGTWRARNGLGVELLRLAPADLRAVDFRSERLSSPRTNYDRTWVEIELPDGRILASARAHVDSQANAIASLRALVGQHRDGGPGAP